MRTPTHSRHKNIRASRQACANSIDTPEDSSGPTCNTSVAAVVTARPRGGLVLAHSHPAKPWRCTFGRLSSLAPEASAIEYRAIDLADAIPVQDHRGYPGAISGTLAQFGTFEVSSLTSPYHGCGPCSGFGQSRVVSHARTHQVSGACRPCIQRVRLQEPALTYVSRRREVLMHAQTLWGDRQEIRLHRNAPHHIDTNRLRRPFAVGRQSQNAYV